MEFFNFFLKFSIDWKNILFFFINAEPNLNIVYTTGNYFFGRAFVDC